MGGDAGSLRGMVLRRERGSMPGPNRGGSPEYPPPSGPGWGRRPVVAAAEGGQRQRQYRKVEIERPEYDPVAEVTQETPQQLWTELLQHARATIAIEHVTTATAISSQRSWTARREDPAAG
jgi:hypothetical protein